MDSPRLLVFACAAVLFLPARPGAAPIHLMPLDWAILAAGAVAGAIGGWHLGRTMAIDVHPENGTLMVRTSSLGLLVLIVLLALRTAVRTEAGLAGGNWPVNPAVIVDALIVFTAAMFTLRSLEMYLRAKKVMAETAHWRPMLDTFLIFLRLGLTSFGGPVAHIGYFRR